ncbi:hypothetical protein CERSUDRAFT_95847 [Gelatoporia subvermispora B]|uniref:Cytochrome P450 n=1 Tax=Ceriporiopsis subvermispora (strain B) TaxID=914234 RepID=M2QWP8_CERS8|nr:hypothetical protein CERSUDRAFT_95847 [Gelatoporia subvermispora B]
MVLNSAKASFDLLEARSANYSDRGQSIITSLFGLEWNTAFIPYGPKWRRHRRAIHQYFNSSAIQEYQPVQLCKTREMLVQALQSPSKILDLIEFAVGSSLIDIAYGHRAQDAQDAYIARAHTAAARTSYVLVSGRFFVEFLPFLRHVPAWLPGAAFKRLANDVVAEQKALVDIPFHDVRAEIDSGRPNTSICARMLDSLDRSESADRDAELEVIKNTTGIIFAAGNDTTNITMRVFLLAMTLHPEAQRAAQEELTVIVGPRRLPESSDRWSLPYIDAIVKECARWMPVVPLGVPHSAVNDDEYEGHHIPKGTVVIPNQWAMLHNPIDYPEPAFFRPERFIKDGMLDPDAKDPARVAFGFGRRICPGRYFADASLFLFIASILHVFDILPPVDEHQRPVLPEARQTSEFISQPEPFECIVKVRSQSAEQLIKNL